MKKGLFELADGGTIFLDEIGDMKLSTQAKLLKVIENKTFKRIGGVRTSRLMSGSLHHQQKPSGGREKEKFREDLYYRLKSSPSCFRPCANGQATRWCLQSILSTSSTWISRNG